MVWGLLVLLMAGPVQHLLLNTDRSEYWSIYTITGADTTYVGMIYDPGAEVIQVSTDDGIGVMFRQRAQPSGVEDTPLAARAGLRVMPNPFDRVAVIQSPSEMDLNLYSVTGARVRTITLQQGLNAIDLGELPSGVYFYRGSGVTGRITKVR